MIERVLTKEVAGLEVVLEILKVDSCLLTELSDSVGYILDMDDVNSFIVWKAALIGIIWLLWGLLHGFLFHLDEDRLDDASLVFDHTQNFLEVSILDYYL